LVLIILLILAKLE